MGLLTRDDWSLERRGHLDQARHQEKVRKAIQDNLSDIISDDGLILSDGKRNVRIPVRSLDEYKFRYDYQKQNQVGQGGAGKATQKGTVVAKERAPGQGGQPGEPGDQPGDEIYETQVNVAEVEDVLFSMLDLPNLTDKDNQKMRVEDVDFRDIRNKGIQSNVDKRRTFLEALKRSKIHHNSHMAIIPEDLRYKTWEDIVKPHSGAVVFAMMDVSGSMGEFEKYCARTFFFWMDRFLHTKYKDVEIRYLAHHTLAMEVDRESFYTRKESGGTVCSSVYALAEQIMAADYPASEWNIYPVHISDGDNISTDMEKCTAYMNRFNALASRNIYIEVNSRTRSSIMMDQYRKIEHPHFSHQVIKDKKDIYPVLCNVFRRREA